MSAPRRFVVTGPPDSGKTTWVEKHRRPGDIVWDFDVIAKAVLGRERHEYMALHLSLILSLRSVVAVFAKDCTEVPCFFIITDPLLAAKYARDLGAELVTMPGERDREP